MITLNDAYWNDRYLENQTGWDIGHASTPIKEYIDQLTNKEIKILIPGCGNAHEAHYLVEQGFKNVFLLDWSHEALTQVKKRIPELPDHHFLQMNFFDHIEKYDLIFEQTFFCAIDPSLRKNYVDHCHDLLNDSGKLVGLLFNDELNSDTPPFGGNKEEYTALFKTKFNIHTMDESYNSIEPRQGRELFFIAQKNAK